MECPMPMMPVLGRMMLSTSMRMTARTAVIHCWTSMMVAVAVAVMIVFAPRSTHQSVAWTATPMVTAAKPVVKAWRFPTKALVTTTKDSSPRHRWPPLSPPWPSSRSSARENPKPTRHCNPDAPTAVPAAACRLRAAPPTLKALSRPSQRLQEFQGGGVFSRG